MNFPAFMKSIPFQHQQSEEEDVFEDDDDDDDEEEEEEEEEEESKKMTITHLKTTMREDEDEDEDDEKSLLQAGQHYHDHESVSVNVNRKEVKVPSQGKVELAASLSTDSINQDSRLMGSPFSATATASLESHSTPTNEKKKAPPPKKEETAKAPEEDQTSTKKNENENDSGGQSVSLSQAGIFLHSCAPPSISCPRPRPHETVDPSFHQLFLKCIEHSLPLLVLWCEWNPFLSEVADTECRMQIFSQLTQPFKQKTSNCLKSITLKSLEKLIPFKLEKESTVEQQKRAFFSILSLCKIIGKQIDCYLQQKEKQNLWEKAISFSFVWLYLWIEEFEKLNPELFQSFQPSLRKKIRLFFSPWIDFSSILFVVSIQFPEQFQFEV